MVKLTLIQGDCLKVLPTIPDNSIDLVVTDPPYGINYQSAWRTDKERFDFLKGDKDNTVNYSFIKECFRVLKGDSTAYIFTRMDVFPIWKKEINSVGFNVKSIIVWDRVIHGLGDLNGSYAPRYDLIIHAVKGNPSLRGKRPQNILRFQRIDVDKMVHPTQKPVKLLEFLIEKSSDKGDTILDCFLGSGSVMLASKCRNCIGIEIEPKYIDICKKRLNWGSSLSPNVEFEFKEIE